MQNDNNPKIEYAKWQNQILQTFYKLKKENLLGKIIENHPFLYSKQEASQFSISDSELQKILIYRMKNYSRKNTDGSFTRIVNLDDFFALCKVIDFKLDDVIDASTIRNTFCDEIYDSRVYLGKFDDLTELVRKHSSGNVFWKYFSAPYNSKKTILLPQDVTFNCVLANYILDNFWSAFEVDIDSSKRKPKSITFHCNIDSRSSKIVEWLMLKREIDLPIEYTEFYSCAFWTLEFDESSEPQYEEIISDTEGAFYKHLKNDKRFEMSFSHFVFQMIVVTIEYIVRLSYQNKYFVVDFREIVHYLTEHPEVCDFIVSLIKLSKYKLNSSTYINCSGEIFVNDNDVERSSYLSKTITSEKKGESSWKSTPRNIER